jgi:Mrp family chromosome partitioning ATPase/capsular polysaccharide biosynthesis protein
MGTAFILAFQPKKYTATASLLLDVRRNQPVIDAQANSPVDSSVVETQIEILKSDAVAATVMDSLSLWSDPEFKKGGGILSRILGLFASSAPKTQRETILKAFKRGVSVRQTGHSYIAEVSYTSLRPDQAAAIANELTKAYIANLFQAKKANADRANEWLLDASGKLLEKAGKAEQDVEDFKTTGLRGNSGTVIDSEYLKQSRVKLRSLEAHAQAYRQVYEGFLNRVGQALPEQTFPVTDARVLGPAMPPIAPSSPNWSLTLLLAALAGGSIGVLSGFVREHLGDRVRGPGFLEEIGLKSLGNIPLVKRRYFEPKKLLQLSQFQARNFQFRKFQFSKFRFREFLGKSKPKPLYFGHVAQSLLRTKLALDAAYAGKEACVIGIVSGDAREGKTTIAYNLAAILAEQDRTALIDLNLRSPRLTQLLSPPKRKGGACSAQPGAFRKNEMGFEFACAPDLNYSAHMPANLIAQMARERLEKARSRFRFVIVDLPSIEHVDICIIAPLIDAFLLVVECGRNDAETLRRSIASAGISDRVVGAVLNKTRPALCE